ncbi:MAG: nucleotide exchange factor GrpE [Elusimicrobiota bacterium]
MSQKENAKPEPPKDPAPAQLDESAKKLAQSEEEKRQVFDQLVRLKAEFENYRKRTDKERPELVRHGKRELLERLIPLYDVLIAAHEQSCRHAELADDEVASELVRGLELIFKEFTKLFEAEGVGVIEALGKPFDFDKHEVLGQVMTDEYPEGTVVSELQRGYLLDGRTLRPAKVKIAKQSSR